MLLVLAVLGLVAFAALVATHRRHRHHRRTRWSQLVAIAASEMAHSDENHRHWHDDDRRRHVRDRVVIRARETGVVPAPDSEELDELVEREL